jgi:hypothetical protein
MHGNALTPRCQIDGGGKSGETGADDVDGTRHQTIA